MGIFVYTELVDEEVIEEFQDHFYNTCESLEGFILELEHEETYNDSVNELFRVFHSLKASAQYFRLQDMTDVTRIAENVLEDLRNMEGPAEDYIIDWLFIINDQFSLWQEEMEKEASDLSPLTERILNAPHLTLTTRIEPKDILKNLSILYVEDEEVVRNNLARYLKRRVKNLYLAENGREGYESYLQNKPDIIITDINMPVANGFRMAREIRKSDTKIPIIIASARNEKIFFKNAKEIGTSGYLIKPIDFDDLQHELEQIISMHFQKPLVETKSVVDIIDESDGFDFSESIKNLPPLPESVMKIENLANDPESAIADMIKIIKDDPIATTSILKAVNSPLYGMKDEVKSIDKAISLFGKGTTRALVLSGALNDSFKIDLSPYGINDEVFSEVSQKRTALMIKWYAKVSFSRLNTLATASLLGNIGQVIMAKEIIRHNKVDEFKEMVNNIGIEKAEMVIAGTTSIQVTAQILEYWGLDEKLINSIKYSSDYTSAPEGFKDYALGCHIIFSLIDLIGTKLPLDIPYNIGKLLEKEGLKPAHLQKALERM